MLLPARLHELIQASSVTTSFVVDPQGQSINGTGNSEGIGNQTDKMLLRALRANAEIVLTSGLTARADHYKMPRTADLAIFTGAGVASLELNPKPGQNLVLVDGQLASNYQSALQHLVNLGYRRIHVEFGVRGLLEILDNIELCVISSRDIAGPTAFMSTTGITQTDSFSLPDLFIAVGSGRGTG